MTSRTHFSYNFAFVACRVKYQFGIGDDDRTFETTAGYFVEPNLDVRGKIEGFLATSIPDFWSAT